MQNEINKLNLTFIKRLQYTLLTIIYSNEGKLPDYKEVQIDFEKIQGKKIKKMWSSRKILKYILLPIVMVYFIIDEILIRLKED